MEAVVSRARVDGVLSPDDAAVVVVAGGRHIVDGFVVL
jgi:hypothetical protein